MLPSAMTNVAEIEDAVARLAPEDLASFRAWFEAFEAERFDRAIELGVARGMLDRFADEASADFRSRKVREL